ncbi:MAG: alpha,alpha-trehalase [Candidatus Omnitrophica bacterium]|nr:alpha,alpha-trehalase [Candidatus Omnitrophota bacterium]
MKSDFKKELNYIKKYWKKTINHRPNDCNTFIGLPNKYISPNHKMFPEMFYWDSYFIIQGLKIEKKYSLIKGIVNNFLYLVNKFGVIPTSNRFYFLAHSQPPFLSSMIKDVFEIYKDKKWLKNAFELAKKEYKNIWTGKYENKISIITKTGLSRFFDINYVHILAEAGSGWDLSPRFLDRCLDILPVDLNCLLYKYEKDFEFFTDVLKNNKEKNYWHRKAQIRKRLINKYFWSNKKGFFFDYDLKNKKQTNIWSLVGYFPLWVKLATKEQARLTVKNLKKFEKKFGIATCDKNYRQPNKQWNYPNGWAPLHLIVTEALENYGYYKNSKRIKEKWLKLCSKVFRNTGKFWEKYDVVKGTVAKSERYPVQEGFGWTNAIFLKFYNDLLSKNKK